MVDWTGLALLFTCPNDAALDLFFPSLERMSFASVHLKLNMVRNILKSDLSVSNARIAGILCIGGNASSFSSFMYCLSYDNAVNEMMGNK